MQLLKAAFEAKDTNVVCLLVLCTACYGNLLQQAPDVRHWTRDHTGGMCEFCLDEARREAL